MGQGCKEYSYQYCADLSVKAEKKRKDRVFVLTVCIFLIFHTMLFRAWLRLTSQHAANHHMNTIALV